jgi:lipoprotein-anchoring transpeptidase ErfK/SrfK
VKRFVVLLFAILAVGALYAVAPSVAAAGEGTATPVVPGGDLPAATAQAGAAAAARDAVPTTLSLSAQGAAVTYGEPVQLQGVLSAQGIPLLPAVTITISVQAAGEPGFTPVGSAAVAPDGSFSFSQTPQHSAVYRADYGGDAALGLAAAAPADCSVQVRPLVRLIVPATAWLGEQATLKGTVEPAYPEGTQITLQYSSGSTWQTLATAALDGQSAFSFAWTPTTAASLKVRALAPADAANAAGASAEHAVLARDPNPHHVPASLAKCIVIDHSEFRVYYYEHGHIVRDFPAVLGKPSTPTPYGRFRVYQKVPHPGGPNGADYLKYDGIIGVHGTDAPQLLKDFPRAFSHGCARLYNKDILWLYPRIPVGTPVWCVR